MRTGLLFLSAITVTFSASAQSVVSTRAGVIYYFDGAVSVDGQPLQTRLGTFPSVGRGAELRTEKGRAEILLTPGVFLRVGENSAIRMVANDLANTQVELLSGAAILDAGEPAAGTSVTLLYKDWQMHPTEAGSYRFDCDPPRLMVLKGNADVHGADGTPVKVETGMDLSLAKVLVPETSGPEPIDALSAWDQGRSDSIAADNAITQQIDGDPATQTLNADGFSYFPMLGMPSPGLYSGAYGMAMPAQPGFYSIYLPGYTFQPLLIGIIGRGTMTRFPGTVTHVGISPLFGTGRGGFGRAGSTGVAFPRPASPMPARPAFRPAMPARPMAPARPMIRR